LKRLVQHLEALADLVHLVINNFRAGNIIPALFDFLKNLNIIILNGGCYMYLLALDASTKATGCAIFKDKELMASTVITASSNDLYKRIHKMVDNILAIVE
jgi:hypothetical protein